MDEQHLAERAVELAELRALYGPRKEWTEIDADTVLIKRTADYGRVEMRILVRFPASYPQARPSIRVKAVKGLSAEDCVLLQSTLTAQATALKGGPMVASLIRSADDWIEDKLLSTTFGDSTTLGSTTPTTTSTSTFGQTTSSPTATSSTTSSEPETYEEASDESLQDFKCFTAAEIISSINAEVQYVQELLKVPQTTARILLSHYMWNTERLVTDFLDSPSRVFFSVRSAGADQSAGGDTATNAKGKEKVGFDEDFDDEVGAKRDAEECFSCPGCFDDSPDFTKLSCNHAFCNDCYKEYLSIKIKDGQADKIGCPAYKCKQMVPASVVEGLVDEDVFKKYNSFLANSYVENNPYVMWCPAPGCQYAIKATIKLNCTVTCLCGNSFCFKCKQEGHFPCTCAMVEQWAKHSKAEKETFQYISKFTRDCPNCETAIEKSGGCNKMTCSYCNFMFCWTCMQNWNTHNFFYSCNRYDPKAQKKAPATAKPSSSLTAAVNASELFGHHYERFTAHDRARHFAAQIKSATQEKLRQLQEAASRLAAASSQNSQRDRHSEALLFASVNDAAALENEFAQSVNVLMQCRRLLKYSYVLSFIVADQAKADKKLTKKRAFGGPTAVTTSASSRGTQLTSKELFEFLQEDLEIATERLSEMLEGDLLAAKTGDSADDAQQFFFNVSRKRADILSAMKVARQRVRGLTDLIEREFVPEDDAEDSAKSRKGRKGVVGGLHPLPSANNVICIGDWAYPIGTPISALVVAPGPSRSAPQSSAAELQKWKDMGYTVLDPLEKTDEEEKGYDDETDEVEDDFEYIPEKVLKKRVRKDDFGRAKPQYLIKWKGLPVDQASWVPGDETECIKLVNAFEKEKKDKARANVAQAKGLAVPADEDKPAPKKKKVKKEKEDLDKKSKKGKEAEFQRLLEEQLLFISKQDMSHLHLLPESTIRNRSEQFIAEYYMSVKEHAGLVLSWGSNSDGVLGHSGGIEQLSPLAVESLSTQMVSAVAAGEFHSLCLTEDGEVWSFGLNDQGQCGQPVQMMDESPDMSAVARPRVIKLDALTKKTVVSIAAGSYHSALITADGELYTFGRGGEFQLGHETVMALGNSSQYRTNSAPPVYYQPKPTRLPALSGQVVKQVSCGRFHTACVTESGALYTWGRGANGQLGHGDVSDQATPKSVAGLKDKVMVKVACGENHSAAVDSAGVIYTAGGDEHGQLGIGDQWICATHGQDCAGIGWSCQERIPLPKTQRETFLSLLTTRHLQFVDVACGYGFCAAITNKGLLYTWGKGTALGLGASGDVSVPTHVIDLTDGVVSVACGDIHAAAITDKGRLYMWGSNEAGRLGNGVISQEVRRSPKPVPAFYYTDQARCLGVSVSPHHSLAISSQFSSLFKTLGAALDSPDFADVTFILENRYTVRAHKAVLTARSRHFRDLFAQRKAKQLHSNEIKVKKVTLETFKRLLEFIYRDRIASEMTKGVATQLAQVARMFGMERLLALCESFLEREVEAVPKSQFVEHMGSIFNDRESSDIAFSFPEEEGGESEEMLIYAHRSILGLRSEYFGAMWRSGMRETTQATIPITYADRKSFRFALQFIYTDDLATAEGDEGTDLDINTGVSLLSLADLLELPKLREIAEKRILCKVRVDNCATVFHIAMMHRAELLKRFCMEIVFQQFVAVKRSAGFAELPVDLQETLTKAHASWWQTRAGRRG